VRDEGRVERVLVVGELAAPPAGRRRRRRVRPADPEPPPVPVTRITVIDPDRLEDEEAAKRWLREQANDEEARGALLTDALRVANAALHAQRAAALDPHLTSLSPARALTIRVGIGTGEEVAAGAFSEAIEVSQDDRRRRRADALRPGERVAAVLAGRERLDACETLLLRARADLDAGRSREAAMQLRVGVEALLAEVPESSGQADDLAELRDRLPAVEQAAAEALAGESAPDAERLAETLRIGERVLRRRRVR
jgi:hypothetical protein